MATLNEPLFSTRGVAQLQRSAGPVRMNANLRNGFHPTANPNGLVNLAIAENTLMFDVLEPYFREAFRLIPEDFTYGDGIVGTKRLCKSWADFMNHWFKPFEPVVPEHIVVGNGLITVLSHLARILADPGEGVLVAAPYYQGFDVSLTAENGVLAVGVPVPPKDMFTPVELEHLERGLEAANTAGKTIRAVILCNPHNPLGRCYPQAVVEEYCRFCEKHNLHLISDEIYAFSRFPALEEDAGVASESVPPMTETSASFFSALSVDLGALNVNPARVHTMYGMSKDFACNGFRIGILISQHNPDLIAALTFTSIFNVVGSPADTLCATLLADPPFLTRFFTTSQTRLLAAYAHITGWIRFHQLGHAPIRSGHTLLVDWRSVLGDVGTYGELLGFTAEASPLEREQALAKVFLENKVMVSPGAVLHMPEAGWTRLTFSIRREYVDEGLKRMERVLGWKQWPGFESS